MLFAGNLIKHPCFDQIRETEAYRIIGDLANTDFVMNNSFWVGVYPGMTQEMLGLYSTLKGITDEEGRVIDDDTARSISMAYGAAAGFLEFAGEGAVAALLVPQLRKYLAGNVSSRALNALLKSPAGKTAWGKALKTGLKTVGVETATEVSQTAAENVGQHVAIGMSDVNKAQKSGKEWMGDIMDTIQQTGEAMIIPSVFGGAVHARHYSKSRQDQIIEMGQRRLKISDKTAEFMQASEVAKKDPEVVEKLMQTMQDNGTLPEQVYIKPEALQEVFFQDGDEELMQAAEKMGVTPEKINEAMALGTDVAIDYSKAASGIMADKMRYAKLRNEMRLDPSDPNAMELEEIQKLNATEEGHLRELEGVVKTIQEDEQKAQARYEERLAIAKPYIDQLVQQGYTQDQANAYGTVLAAAAQRMAPAFGMEPAEYLQAKFGGYERMTREEFDRLANSTLEELLANRGKNGGKAKANTAEALATALHEEFTAGQPKLNSTVENGILKGADTTLIGSRGDEKAHYEIREAGSLIPSHDPTNGFAKRADYPEGVQERPYHSDVEEQNKVRQHAADLKPALLISDNAEASNGPSIITKDGIVLGGNSRVMTMQTAYANHPEKAAAYRAMLKERAERFGMDPAVVDGFTNPVLVRVVDEDMDVPGMAMRSRLYNETTTQGLQAKAEGVSRARMISDDTLAVMASDMEDFDTLREYLASPASKRLVESLINDGVIEKTQIARLVEGGKLTDEGKALVENALRGMIVQDYDVLQAAPASALQKLDRSILPLAQLKKRGGGWDMSKVVTEALRIIGSASAKDTSVSMLVGQNTLMQGMNDASNAKKSVQAVALTLENATPKEVAARFAQMAKAAGRPGEGSSQGLLGVKAESNTPTTAFIESFLRTVATVDGKPVKDFNPTKNENHAALEYAFNHGHSITTAQAAIEKQLHKKKISAEERERLRGYLSALGTLSGNVAVYPTKLGQFFSYQPGQALFQSVGLDAAAQEKLDNDAAAWRQTVQNFVEGKLDRKQGALQILSQTPLVFTLVKAKQLPVNTKASVLRKVMYEKHGLSADLVKQIAEKLADPVMIVKSTGKNSVSDITVMLELKDKNNASIVVPVIFSDKKHGYEMNFAPSIYAKNNEKTKAPSDEWFEEQLRAGNVLYANRKKVKGWNRIARRRLPGWNSIPNAKTIKFEDDLVNARTANPGFYAKDGKAARGALRQMADGRYIVGLFRKRNLSTVLHETSHFWLQELRDAAKLPDAPEWIKDCWAKLQQTYKFEGFLDDPAQFEQWREVQENWARQFEAYCREGKAPSEELQSAFNRFRSWLMDIYKTVRRLLGNGGVNEDVREVFDRLLATQEEIDASQRSTTSASVIEEFVDEVAPELRDKYAKAVRVAHDRASLAIANRRLVEQRAAEKEARAAAMGELLNSPEYQAIAKFREWGLPYEGLLAAVNEETANNLRAKWGKWAKEKALIRPMKMSAEKAHAALQDVAEQLNMATVDDLVGWLLHTPTEQEFIAQSVERSMQEWNAAYDGEVDYSDAMDEALGIELEALTGQTQIGTQALRREMDMRTGVKKMAEVDAEYKALKAALRREAQAARKIVAEVKRSTTAEVKGKLSEAAKEKLRKVKEQERLRRAALAADYRARIEREHILRQLKRIAGSKSVPYEYMLQIRRTLQNWGLLTSSQKIEPSVLRGLPSFSEFLASTSLMEGDETTVPSWIENQERGRPGDLSLERLREMKDFLASVAHQGRTQDQMLGAMEKGRIADVAQKCKDQADTMQAIDDMPEESRRSLMEQTRSFFRGMLSEMGFVRFMARRLDNYKNTGLFHRVLLFPLQQAQSRELSLRKEYTDKLREVLKPLFDHGLQAKQFTIDGVRLSDDVSARWKGLWDMDKVYAVALNMGNAGNLKALMRGYGWSEEDLLRITSRLSSEEWQAIQKIWDTIDELYPALNEVAMTLKGAPLPKVKGQSFSVVAADGKIVKLKGGYYPLIFDQTFSDKAAIQQNNDDLINGMEAIMRKPNPKDGMTKTRTGGTLPPRLSMQVLDRHITDTCHYISYAIPLRDTQRLISEPAFKQGFVRAMGRENYQELLPWLRGIARPGNPNAGTVERKLDWLAQRASIWALGMNLKSSLLQLTSVGNSWSEVGVVPFTKAAFRMILNPLKMVQEVRHHSAYMQTRMQLLDDTLRREYDDIKKKDVFGLRLNGRLFSLDSLRQAQMALIGILDSAVAMPTWMAAYERAVERGVSEDEAVAEADSTVVAAQGGGGNMDTASLMRNKAWMRVLCPFMSFAMADNARKREAIGGLREWLSSHGQTGISPVQFSRRFAYESVLPVVLTVWLVGLGREGEPPEPEDYLWEALGFHTMGVPFARDIARGLESSFTGKGIGGRTPLALGWMDNMAKSVKDVAKIAMDEDDDKTRYRALKEIVNVAGFFAGVGTPQIWRTIEGSQAYFVDGEGGPLAPALGKPQKKNQ